MFLVILVSHINGCQDYCSGPLFLKVLMNFCRNLTIRHLVDCLHTYDSSTEVASFKTFFEFALCVTRTKYQNRFCITNTCNYRIVINIEMSR